MVQMPRRGIRDTFFSACHLASLADARVRRGHRGQRPCARPAIGTGQNPASSNALRGPCRRAGAMTWLLADGGRPTAGAVIAGTNAVPPDAMLRAGSPRRPGLSGARVRQETRAMPGLDAAVTGPSGPGSLLVRASWAGPGRAGSAGTAGHASGWRRSASTSWPGLGALAGWLRVASGWPAADLGLVSWCRARLPAGPDRYQVKCRAPGGQATCARVARRRPKFTWPGN